MSLLKGPTDYAQRGHLFFKDTQLRGEVFRYLRDTLEEMADRRDARGAGTQLTPVIDLMEGRKTLLVSPDPELQDMAWGFFKEHVETILRLAACAKNGWERSKLLYALVKFLPRLANDLPHINRFMAGGYLILIHTLHQSENYREGNCLGLVVKGLYRWDGGEILNTWGTAQEVQSILAGLREDERRPYEQLAELAHQVYQALKKGETYLPYGLLFLLFTTGFLPIVRHKLLAETGKDLLWSMVHEKMDAMENELQSLFSQLFPQEKELLSEVTAFVEGRLGEEIKSPKKGLPFKGPQEMVLLEKPIP